MQAITSISVHPTTPHLFCTTSRDFTTRIYDLGLPATFEMLPVGSNKNDKWSWSGVPNPPWPPGKGPSLAGAAHGLRLPFSVLQGTGEREGGGTGRCVSVLLGGRSAGHNSAVLASVRQFNVTHVAEVPDEHSRAGFPPDPPTPRHLRSKPIFNMLF